MLVKPLLHKFIELLILWNGKFYLQESGWKETFMCNFKVEIGGWIDYNLKRMKFRKQHKGQMRGITTQGNSICFGRFGLQALELAWITSRQIEARWQTITHYAHHDGKIWIHIFLDKPKTMQPAETCMGLGKGSP